MNSHVLQINWRKSELGSQKLLSFIMKHFWCIIILMRRKKLLTSSSLILRDTAGTGLTLRSQAMLGVSCQWLEKRFHTNFCVL